MREEFFKQLKEIGLSSEQLEFVVSRMQEKHLICVHDDLRGAHADCNSGQAYIGEPNANGTATRMCGSLEGHRYCEIERYHPEKLHEFLRQENEK